MTLNSIPKHQLAEDNWKKFNDLFSGSDAIKGLCISHFNISVIYIHT